MSHVARLSCVPPTRTGTQQWRHSTLTQRSLTSSSAPATVSLHGVKIRLYTCFPQVAAWRECPCLINWMRKGPYHGNWTRAKSFHPNLNTCPKSTLMQERYCCTRGVFIIYLVSHCITIQVYKLLHQVYAMLIPLMLFISTSCVFNGWYDISTTHNFSSLWQLKI